MSQSCIASVWVKHLNLITPCDGDGSHQHSEKDEVS